MTCFAIKKCIRRQCPVVKPVPFFPHINQLTVVA